MAAEETYPDDLRYHREHDWARIEDGEATLGITWYAQDALGELVHFEPPEEGTALEVNQSYGEVESVKAVSDLISPLSGEVLEVNQKVVAEPETVNEDPYGEGWLVRIRLAEPSQVDELLDAAAYNTESSSPRSELARPSPQPAFAGQSPARPVPDAAGGRMRRPRRESVPARTVLTPRACLLCQRRPRSARSVMSYLSLTDRDREEMLGSIGVSSVEELFVDIPAGVRFDRELDVPPALSEPELVAHLSELAAKNVHTGAELSFLGAGIYDHYVPAVVARPTSRR